jgi:hypothetical protein
MAFTPDLPFPKSAGDQIRSKDWNDLVVETKRLDTAKVERAGDAITGPLSVAGALAIGKSLASATSKLDVAGDLRVNDSNLYFRGGTDLNHGLGWFGTGKLFAGANVDGPVLFGNSGGALGNAPGGVQKIALQWDVNGNVCIGVPSTTLKVDVSDRIRLRQGPNGSAGLWLHQTAPNADRAFVGMVDDNSVGFWGASAGWGLYMNVTTGDLNVSGQINSSRFRATEVINAHPGPLSLSGQFTSAGGTLLVFASGSGYAQGNAHQIGMQVQLDGGVIGQAMSFTNEINSHKCFSSAFSVVTSYGGGVHTLALNPIPGTVSDFNDFFNVVVLELPFR